MMHRTAALGAVLAGLAVAAGAFAAHGLRETLEPAMLAVFRTGAQYQFYHALALILTALLAGPLGPRRGLRLAAGLFAAGIVLFAGSLYALALTGISGLGLITPLGGLAFLLGWGVLAMTLWNARGD